MRLSQEPPARECWDELPALAADEGSHLATVNTNSEAECKQGCEAADGCLSVSFCPQWSGCWLRGRAFVGGEATVSKGECKTLYRKVCDSGAVTTAAPTATPSPAPSPPGHTAASRCPSALR